MPGSISQRVGGGGITEAEDRRLASDVYSSYR